MVGGYFYYFCQQFSVHYILYINSIGHSAIVCLRFISLLLQDGRPEIVTTDTGEWVTPAIVAFTEKEQVVQGSVVHLNDSVTGQTHVFSSASALSS